MIMNHGKYRSAYQLVSGKYRRASCILEIPEIPKTCLLTNCIHLKLTISLVINFITSTYSYSKCKSHKNICFMQYSLVSTVNVFACSKRRLEF